ncbi:MAG TPA: hypothetical protein VGD96_22180 [Bradyrhizobium sp.]
MPSERTDGVLRDILHHIDLVATQFVKGFDLEAFKPALPSLRSAIEEEISR